MRATAVLYLNGKRIEVGPEHAGRMLSEYMRDHLGLTGTKVVCAEGDCGACTVLRAFAGFDRGEFKYQPINSCLVTMAQLDGSSLVSIEALAQGDQLTPVQASMVKCHGSQCGYCTPGFVMAMTGLVEKKLSDKNRSISLQEAKNALTGNLCRCTGYQPIIDATLDVNVAACQSVAERYSSSVQRKDLQAALTKPLRIEGENFRFYAPRSLKAAAQCLAQNKSAKLLAAATDLGVLHNKWRSRLVDVVSLHLIPELYEFKVEKNDRVSVGARVSLSELRTQIQDLVPEFARFLDLFASPQIKNVATLVGNVANASPIADTPPFLLVADAVVKVVGPRGSRAVPLEKFFLDYRKTALKAGELISSIQFSIPAKDDLLSLKKVSERKDLDISTVNAAFRASVTPEGGRNFRIALGGVAGTTLRLKKTEAVLNHPDLTPERIERAMTVMHQEITPLSDVRGSSAYRHVVVENLLRRFLFEATS